jgi:hypothetical protein
VAAATVLLALRDATVEDRLVATRPGAPTTSLAGG